MASGSIFRAGELLWTWTGRNVRARYQQSVLGWLWALVQPAAQVAIFSAVFTFIVPVDTGTVPYVVFSFVAVAPWTLLATALPDMTNSIVDNMSLVTKIYFVREVLPVAAMLARLLDFGVAAGLLIVLMAAFHVPFFSPALFFVPVILLVQLALMLGLGLMGAALNVFFRDVRSLLMLGLQLWFYASPVIYPVTSVPQRLRPYYYLNPMAGIIEAYRDVLLHERLPGLDLYQSALLSAAILAVGYWCFKRVETRFADIV